MTLVAAIALVHYVCYVGFIVFGAVLVVSNADSKYSDLKNAIGKLRKKNPQDAAEDV